MFNLRNHKKLFQCNSNKENKIFSRVSSILNYIKILLSGKLFTSITLSHFACL
jgi:hypothetical protein